MPYKFYIGTQYPQASPPSHPPTDFKLYSSHADAHSSETEYPSQKMNRPFRLAISYCLAAKTNQAKQNTLHRRLTAPSGLPSVLRSVYNFAIKNRSSETELPTQKSDRPFRLAISSYFLCTALQKTNAQAKRNTLRRRFTAHSLAFRLAINFWVMGVYDIYIYIQCHIYIYIYMWRYVQRHMKVETTIQTDRCAWGCYGLHSLSNVGL